MLSGATVQRILAGTSSFFEWAIAAEEYTAADNPMQKRVDEALRRVPDRHEPFVGAASRQRPLRRTVRVRLPLRLPRPLTAEDVDALLASSTSLRDLAILLLMLDGGLRPGEVLCLQPADIAYGRRRVTIRKRDEHPRGARAKARRERVVDLHEPRTLDAVSRYVLHERPLDSDSPFVFLVGGSGGAAAGAVQLSGVGAELRPPAGPIGHPNPGEDSARPAAHPRHGDVGERDARTRPAAAARSRLSGVDPDLHPGLRRAGSVGVPGSPAWTLMTAATRAGAVGVPRPVDQLQHVSRGCYREWV